MARVDLPNSGLRKRRRRRRWFLAGGIVCACLALLGGIVWLSWAPFLRITAIQVVDAQMIASSTITAYAQQEISGAYGWLFARNNIFLYPRHTIAQGLLRQYPALRAVDVHAKDFHTVSIAVSERQPVALWCGLSPSESKPCLFLDEEGFAYAPAPTFSAPVYISYYGALSSSTPPVYLATSQFQSLFAFVATLLQKENTETVTSVAVDAQDDARVVFGSDFTLLFSLKDDGGDVFERFSLALTSDPFNGKTLADFQYLDLRFGDKLYYKLK